MAPDIYHLALQLMCSMGEGGGDEFFTEWEESYDSFDDMGLHENLLRGIYAYGGPASSTRPSAIKSASF